MADSSNTANGADSNYTLPIQLRKLEDFSKINNLLELNAKIISNKEKSLTLHKVILTVAKFTTSWIQTVSTFLQTLDENAEILIKIGKSCQDTNYFSSERKEFPETRKISEENVEENYEENGFSLEYSIRREEKEPWVLKNLLKEALDKELDDDSEEEEEEVPKKKRKSESFNDSSEGEEALLKAAASHISSSLQKDPSRFKELSLNLSYSPVQSPGKGGVGVGVNDLEKSVLAALKNWFLNEEGAASYEELDKILVSMQIPEFKADVPDSIQGGLKGRTNPVFDVTYKVKGKLRALFLTLNKTNFKEVEEFGRTLEKCGFSVETKSVSTPEALASSLDEIKMKSAGLFLLLINGIGNFPNFFPGIHFLERVVRKFGMEDFPSGFSVPKIFIGNFMREKERSKTDPWRGLGEGCLDLEDVPFEKDPSGSSNPDSFIFVGESLKGSTSSTPLQLLMTGLRERANGENSFKNVLKMVVEEAEKEGVNVSTLSTRFGRLFLTYSGNEEAEKTPEGSSSRNTRGRKREAEKGANSSNVSVSSSGGHRPLTPTKQRKILNARKK